MMFWGVVIVLVLAVALLTPFLLKELRKGAIPAEAWNPGRRR